MENELGKFIHDYLAYFRRSDPIYEALATAPSADLAGLCSSDSLTGLYLKGCHSVFAHMQLWRCYACRYLGRDDKRLFHTANLVTDHK